MHIIFLNPQGNFDRNDTGWTLHPDFGGQLVYVKEVAVAMAAKGHKVDIITRQIKSDSKWTQFSEKLDCYDGVENLRILRLPCGPDSFLVKEDLWAYLGEWVNNIVQLYKDEGSMPDFATGHYGDGGLACVLFKDATGIPFTLTGHSLGAQKLDKFLKEGVVFEDLIKQFHFDKRIAAERLAMAWASKIIVSTEQERLEQYSHRVYNDAVDANDPEKFSVIPPGVNLAVFGEDKNNSVEDEVTKKVERMIARDIPQERRNLPMVICSSRLEKKKNHVALVKAWAENEKLRNKANLAIILRGSENPIKDRATLFKGDALEILDEVDSIIKSASIAGCVTSFDLNSQAELAACYRYLGKNKMGVFCLTALYEPFGLAPLEAMAAGLAAVVTKNGGPSESMQDQNGEYGVLVDPENPSDIANGLLRVVSDEASWKKFKTAGIGRVHSKYTWEKTAESYLDTINLVLKRSDRSDSKDYPMPRYFKDTKIDDIDGAWLKSKYF